MKRAKRFLAFTLAAYGLALGANFAYGMSSPTWATDPTAAAVAAENPLERRTQHQDIQDTEESADGVEAVVESRPTLEAMDAPDPEAISEPGAATETEWELGVEWESETPWPLGNRNPAEAEAQNAVGPGEAVAEDGPDAETEAAAEQPSTTEASSAGESSEVEASDAESPGAESPEAESSEAASSIDRARLFIGLSEDQVKRSQLLMEADQHFLAGDRAAANALYRQAKEAKWLAEMTSGEVIVPITDPEDLSPAGRVYWREAQAGLDSGFPNRVLVPLELLVRDYPDFLPAQSLYGRYLIQQGRTEEARQLLESLALRFPYHPDVLNAQIQLQMAQEQWIEAAITANQFALLNPEHPDAGAMEQLAQENFNRFRGQINANLTRNLVGNIITGAASYFLTGGLFGPFTALNSGILMMQGESVLGQQVADQVKRQLPIVTDPEVRDYVNEIGHKLAALAGRDEFNYSFEVVMDENLNAFALPGGKIFINAGAITNSYSEAELAGLLGHEISHAVLSHGFQMVTQGNLTASLAAFIPVPQVANIAANLLVASYSRDMERQSDILGTKLLATGNYAADGLHNLMTTLEAEHGNRGVTWFASHPNPGERVSYIKQLIDQGGFDRYTYEGVEKHLTVRLKTLQLINEYKLENSRQDKLPRR
ncbi:M48 family metalloprotease [Leptolyngbya sp. BL0902]|uniref:M48 family metalloprotease n=1 Tax=Leptolyngbya sp. BL0902 TaxID=1115757 RepID=UPI001CED0B51|nr:M48 family metalloprotease [Leptolyngbya sp. BL0902]